MCGGLLIIGKIYFFGVLFPKTRQTQLLASMVYGILESKEKEQREIVKQHI